MSRNDIDAQERGFYFSKSGQSRFDGATFERPKPNMQEAIDAASALDPPPSPTLIAVVSSAQGGSFTQGFVLSDFIQFNGEDISITTSAPIAINAASFLSCRLTTLVNTFNGGIGFNVDDEQSLGIDCQSLRVFGTGGSIGVKVSGTVNDLFFNLSQIILGTDGSIGIDMTATMTTPIDMNVNAVSMDADNTIFCQCDPVSPTDTCVISVSSIKKKLLTSNTTAFNIKNGTLVIESGNIQVDIALKIEDGATCNILCQRVIGDIIVEAGGRLFCTIANHVGTITNAGLIQGRIDNTIFDPVSIIALLEPDTTPLATHQLTGDDGGDSRDFFTVRDPKGNIEGNPGDFAYRNAGVLSRIYQHRGEVANDTDWVNISDSEIETIIISASFATQNPVGTDNALQIEFGAAQNGPSDPVQLASDGTITINVTGQYSIQGLIQYGRTGAGQASLLFFRRLINGVQSGDSVFAKLDNSNANIPAQLSTVIKLNATDIVTFELIRDSAGFDSGGLFSDNPTAAGWNDSASSIIKISRRILL